MEVVAYLVDGFGFGLGQGAFGVESIWGLLIFGRRGYLSHLLTGGAVELTLFEEEPDLVARFEEIVVANMIALLTRGELGHRVIIQRELVEHLMRFTEQLLDSVRRQGIWEKEVTIRVPELHLLRGEADIWVRRWWRGDARGSHVSEHLLGLRAACQLR